METANTLFNYVCRIYGLPEDIVSDQGPQFTSKVWQAFCKQLNINISLTFGYHPQASGQEERLNQKTGRYLRYAQNSLTHSSPGPPTPFQCILGYQPPMFPWSGEPSSVPVMGDWIRRSEECGTVHMFGYSEQYVPSESRRTDGDIPTLTISLVRGSGCLHRTSICDFPVGS